jgi:DNA repair exonuclease SbcCD nuclease subunit
MPHNIRFLATGDLQIHPWKQFSYTKSNGMNSRLYNCLKVLDIMRKEAHKRGITKILLNGDILEETDYIQVEVYDGLYRKIERMCEEGLDVVVNCGNHDICKQSSGRVLHSLRPLRQVATVVEEPTLVWDALQVVPWMADSEALKKAIRRVRSSRSYGLALHCGVQGAKTGPTAYLVRNPIKLRDIRSKEFGLVLLSDYHTRQWLSKNALYLGSPLQHSFGEIHRPCIWDVRLFGHDPYFDARKIYTNLPRFRRLDVSRIKDLRRKVEALRGDYVKLHTPAGGGVSEADIQKVVKGKFLYDIEETSEEQEDKPDTSSLHPLEVISQYARSKVSSPKKLVSLGIKLYKGEV